MGRLGVHVLHRSRIRSSVAQRQSIRLLTGGLLVRIQPEEPTSLTKSGTSVSAELPSGPLCPFLALCFLPLPFGAAGGVGGGGSSRLTSAEEERRRQVRVAHRHLHRLMAE